MRRFAGYGRRTRTCNIFAANSSFSGGSGAARASRCWRLIYREELDLFRRVLSQGRHDKNKIYSLHDPIVLCIGKGKAHKKWEFGRKASVAMTRDSGVIVGTVSFEENWWDGDTLWMTMIQSRNVAQKSVKSALVDRRYQGVSEVSGVKILAPHRKKKDGNLLPETEGPKAVRPKGSH